jgi:antitoxin VapB
MSKRSIAKLFTIGRSQVVKLPGEFRFRGDSVRIRRAGNGVLLEPVFTDVKQWFAEMDRFKNEPFMPEGRKQSLAPIRQIFK